MKRSKTIWNYIDMFLQTLLIFLFILTIYIIAENLERYIYRYTLFPFITVILIFALGIILGRGIEKTKRNKPVGLISKKMSKLKKKKNYFIFQENGQTYIPHKEIIEDIKSGEIVHVKHFSDSQFTTEEFYDMYKIEMDNLVDNKMDEKENNSEEKKQ